jgi:hypothetical protein
MRALSGSIQSVDTQHWLKPTNLVVRLDSRDGLRLADFLRFLVDFIKPNKRFEKKDVNWKHSDRPAEGKLHVEPLLLSCPSSLSNETDKLGIL